MKTIIKEGNGEFDSYIRGVFQENDGTYTVLTYTRSYKYKTLRAAMKKWNEITGK